MKTTKTKKTTKTRLKTRTKPMHKHLVVRKYKPTDVFLHPYEMHAPQWVQKARRLFGKKALPSQLQTDICDPLGSMVWEYEDIPQKDTDNELLLVLIDKKQKSRVVGIAHFVYKEGIHVLVGLCVYPEYRGRDKGITTMFITTAMAVATETFRNAKTLYMLPSEMGTKLYTSVGFRAIKSGEISDKQRQAITGGMMENVMGFGSIMSCALRNT